MPKPLVELPVPAAAAPDQAGGQACQPLHVPGLSTEGALQPAKLSVWKLFMEQVCSSQHELCLKSSILTDCSLSSASNIMLANMR